MKYIITPEKKAEYNKRYYLKKKNKEKENQSNTINNADNKIFIQEKIKELINELNILKKMIASN